jgi:hypothetical protein
VHVNLSGNGITDAGCLGTSHSVSSNSARTASLDGMDCIGTTALRSRYEKSVANLGLGRGIRGRGGKSR